RLPGRYGAARRMSHWSLLRPGECRLCDLLCACSPFGAPRDQPRAAAARHEAERPAGEDEQPVLQPDQIEDVDAHPDQPGKQAAYLDALDLRNRMRTADRCQVALVDEAER